MLHRMEVQGQLFMCEIRLGKGQKQSDSLKRKLKVTWADFDEANMRACCMQVLRRLEVVAKAKGGHF